MNRTVKLIIAIGIIAILVNDGGRWGKAAVDLRSATGEVLSAVQQTAARATQPELAAQLKEQATIREIRVTQFATGPESIQIWTEKDVAGTWVVGPAMALSKGVPFARAWATRFSVRHSASAALR
jgi:hypothetical protein